MSGNVPQQNLKRREAAFCWARRRFAPAKCRNALLLSSKSAKLSFSQEKLLTTHCHEPAHISHQWTCESVSGSHLGNEATRRIRSVAMIHRMTETEPQGSVNTTCLVREPTSAFSVRWGGSYCPLCSTPRNRGAAPRGKHHHTFLRIKV